MNLFDIRSCIFQTSVGGAPQRRRSLERAGEVVGQARRPFPPTPDRLRETVFLLVSVFTFVQLLRHFTTSSLGRSRPAVCGNRPAALESSDTPRPFPHVWTKFDDKATIEGGPGCERRTLWTKLYSKKWNDSFRVKPEFLVRSEVTNFLLIRKLIDFNVLQQSQKRCSFTYVNRDIQIFNIIGEIIKFWWVKQIWLRLLLHVATELFYSRSFALVPFRRLSRTGLTTERLISKEKEREKKNIYIYLHIHILCDRNCCISNGDDGRRSFRVSSE